MKSRRVVLVLLGLSAFGIAESRAAEQEVEVRFRDVFAGDCSVTVELAGARADRLLLRLNTEPLRVRVTQRAPLVLALDGGPLEERDLLELVVDGRSATTAVRPRPKDLPPASGCAKEQPPSQPAWEGRNVFEAVAFAGRAIDNFAPAEIRGYRPGPRSLVELRAASGVTVEYRPFHFRSDQLQIWVTGTIVDGVRTADLDCTKEQQAVLCGDFDPEHPSTFFLRTLEHASSREAHFDPRLEFATLNRDSPTPVRLFVGGQFGFLALGDGTKVFESDSVGFGAVVAKGPFRRSSVFWGWGQSGHFQSNPGWNRLKINGGLAVDVFAGLVEKFPVLKYFGFGAWRGFFAVAIDRNPGGPGPDSVQTYIGALFDFDRAFRP